MNRELTAHVTLRSLEDTGVLAAAIAADLRGGLTLCFSGELGTGKTTLVRSMVSALGSNASVSSPTFVLSHDYTISEELTIEHWDLYRLSAAPEDLFDPPSSRVVRIIEWAEREQALLESADLLMKIVIDPISDCRSVLLKGPFVKYLRIPLKIRSSEGGV